MKEIITSVNAKNPAMAHAKCLLEYLERDYPEDMFLFLKLDLRQAIPALGGNMEKSNGKNPSTGRRTGATD